MDSSLHAGRFQEQHYWDSWIVKGLLKSQLFSIANDTLQNFMDETERFGFIPNGGRIYDRNRSQPPLFIQMLACYVAASNDTAIFTPQARKPHNYLTIHDPTQPTLNASQSAALYAEFASGAETGWDYASRWLTNPTIPNPNVGVGGGPWQAGLRALNVKGTIPVAVVDAHNAWPPHEYIALEALCVLPTGQLGMLEDALRAQGINASVSGLEQRVDKRDGGEWGECDGGRCGVSGRAEGAAGESGREELTGGQGLSECVNLFSSYNRYKHQ
ncbi:Six-hairpin glycosidase-like protein [Mycena epipterygia]|nr:Six-hairpin glycosidase-like protein [Mycena epipterygia]